MDSAREIVAYLEALARELVARGVRDHYHILVTGGAWMLLAGQRRSTEDVDFALIVPPSRARRDKVMGISVQHGGEIATRASSSVFAQAIESVAALYGLPIDWLNDECASYLYTDAPSASGYLWQSFSGVLHVYLPTAEYVFVLKVFAYRRKDRADVQALLQVLDIRTQAQAQAVIDKFLSPEAQMFWEVPKKLKRLFR
ncbi:MAG TPA: hypothetical protein VFV38_41330 [Ktedonobacteraceae bacterium]|nr:hypothetical protein [Ktedonobacteraceae bacterium]